MFPVLRIILISQTILNGRIKTFACLFFCGKMTACEV